MGNGARHLDMEGFGKQAPILPLWQMGFWHLVKLSVITCGKIYIMWELGKSEPGFTQVATGKGPLCIEIQGLSLPRLDL